MLAILASFLALSCWSIAARADEKSGSDIVVLAKTVDVDSDGVQCDYVVPFDGTVSMWARSDVLDPRLEVVRSGATVAIRDSDSGGGTTAWVLFDALEGERLNVTVARQIGVGSSSSDVATSPEVALTDIVVVFAPENDATRAIAMALKAEVGEIEASAARGEVDAARERVAAVLDRLVAIEGAATSESVAVVSSRLGETARVLARNDVAERAWSNSYAYFRRTRPSSQYQCLATASNLATVKNRLGDLRGALELREAVCIGFAAIVSPHEPDLLRAKHNLAVTRAALGDLEGALQLNEEVLAAWELSLAPDHPDVLEAKRSLAGTRHALGDVVGATALFQFVHDAWVQRGSPAEPRLVHAKLNLALTRKGLGDFEGARALEEEVLAVWRATRPPDDPDVLLAELNLSSTLMELGDFVAACGLLEEIHEVLARRGPAEHPDLLAAKAGLALASEAAGDLDRARALSEEVLAARERLLSPDHPDLAAARLNLAALCARNGDHEVAAELLTVVRGGWAVEFPSGHEWRLKADAVFLFNCLCLRDWVGVRRAARDVLTGQLAVVEQLWHTAPRIARAAAERELKRFEFVLHAASSAGAESPLEEAVPARELFAVLESLRAVSTFTSTVERAVASDPTSRSIQLRLIAASAELAGAVHSIPAGPAGLEEWRRRIFELSEERDRIQGELAFELADRGVEVPTIDVASVAAALEPEAVFISYFRTGTLSHRFTQSPEASVSAGTLIAFVVRPNGAFHCIDLGPAAPIEALVVQWRASVGRPIERGIEAEPDAADETNETGARLRAALLDPCLDRLPARPQTLHVVLDDFLHLAPVDALPMPSGELAGAVLEVRIESSVATLLLDRPRATEARHFVAVGDVDFDAVLESSTPYGGRLGLVAPPVNSRTSPTEPSAPFARLLQTRFEIEALGELWKEIDGQPPITLTRAGATKSSLIENAPRARWLHIATHGWMAPAAVRSTADVDDSQSLAAAEATLALRGFAPQALCGIALAGANHGTDASGRVPGILTAEELATLDLSNCELAVLSACETNVGIRRAGQGIQSLQTALHAAGARTAITSLWKVDDAATRRLFELFYTKLWSDKLGPADALWQAKMALRSEGHPTRDWSGWVLTGDPD